METQMILAGAGAGFISKVLFDWIKGNGNGKKKNGNGYWNIPSECRQKLDSIQDEVGWLKEVHNKTDENGMPIWYVPRDLLDSCKKTAESTRETVVLLQENQELLRQMLTK